ncbi:MAG: hypothetical protein AAF194_08130 [Pseudomonadota bacterium]
MSKHRPDRTPTAMQGSRLHTALRIVAFAASVLGLIVSGVAGDLMWLANFIGSSLRALERLLPGSRADRADVQ